MTNDVEEERHIHIRVIECIELKGNADTDDITILSGKASDDRTTGAN